MNILYMEEKEKMFDVAVIGAGPVGLLHAYELSKDLSVILIDKDETPSTHKSWAVPISWLEGTPLEDCVFNIAHKLGIYSYPTKLDQQIELPDRYSVVSLDSKKMYDKLLKGFTDQGGVLQVNTRVKELSLGSESVIVNTSKDKINAELAIDCRGHRSSFLKDEKKKFEYYWSVYGTMMESETADSGAAYIIAYIMDYNSLPVYVSLIAEGKNTFTPWIVVLHENKFRFEEMEKIHAEAIKQDFFIKRNFKSIKTKPKYGWIPAIDPKSRVRDRVLSLGDANGISALATGMSLSYTLKKYKKICSDIVSAMKSSQLDKKEFEAIVNPTPIEELNFDVNKLVVRLIRNLSKDELEKFIKCIPEVELESMLNLVIGLEATPKEIIRLHNIVLKHFSIVELVSIAARDGLKNDISLAIEIAGDLAKLI